jgi:probable phosphoglycerate mutase
MQTPSDQLYNRVWTADAQNPFHELFGVESVADVTKRMTEVIRAQEERQKDPEVNVEDNDEEEEEWVVLVSHGDSLQILQTAMRGWSGDRHRQLEHLETANWRVVEWCPELQAGHQSSRT